MTTDWDFHFEQLVEYKKANGDWNVKKNDSQHFELGRWIAKQRFTRTYKVNRIGSILRSPTESRVPCVTSRNFLSALNLRRR